VEPRHRGLGDSADLVRLEGFRQGGTLFWALGGVGDGIEAQAEGVLAPCVLEDRVQNLAMHIHGPGADVLAVQSGQEAADVRRDRGEFAPAELAHDPTPRCFARPGLGFGEHRSVTVEGRRLHSLLELQVFHPQLGRVLETRLAHPQGDFLFDFDLVDHLAHLSIGPPLVEEAVAEPAAPLPPAAARLRFSHARPSRRLRCRPVPSRHYAS